MARAAVSAYFASMLNNRTTALDLLLTRRSGKPRDMIAPGPGADELATMLAAAARVPDHGKIAPWRFVVIPVELREAFADVLAGALTAEMPDAGERDRADARQFALQAPTLIAVLSVPDRAHKVPVREQRASVGAATQNLLLAGHALGYVGSWLTGWAAYSLAVYEALGGDPGGRVEGFLFFGTPTRPLDERPRPVLVDIARTWMPRA